MASTEQNVTFPFQQNTLIASSSSFKDEPHLCRYHDNRGKADKWQNHNHRTHKLHVAVARCCVSVVPNSMGAVQPLTITQIMLTHLPKVLIRVDRCARWKDHNQA